RLEDPAPGPVAGEQREPPVAGEGQLVGVAGGVVTPASLACHPVNPSPVRPWPNRTGRSRPVAPNPGHPPFVNRDAAPSYAGTADGRRRSVQAGVMPPPPVGGHYQLSPGWQRRVRQWGEGAAVPEEGMIAFAQWLSSGGHRSAVPDASASAGRSNPCAFRDQ